MKKLKKRTLPARKPSSQFVDKNQIVFATEFKDDACTPSSMQSATGWFLSSYQTKLKRIKELAFGRKTLDVGCAAGVYLIPLLESGIDVYGIDYVSRFANNANALINKVAGHEQDQGRVICEDICNTSLQDHSFEFIYSLSTFPYIKNKDIALKEIFRMLSDHGIVYIEFGNSEAMAHQKALRAKTGVEMYNHPVSEIFDMVHRAGFEVIATRFGQIFPMHLESSDTKNDSLVSSMLKEYMGRFLTGDVTVDEAVSSSLATCHYAYRVTLVLKKPSGILEKPSMPVFKPGIATKWLSQDIAFNFEHADIEKTVAKLARCLFADPTDCFAVYGLMKLHGKNYDQIAEKYLKEVRKNYGDNLEPGKRIFIVADKSSLSIANANKKKTISVVLPVYNGMPYLPKCLESLYNQTVQDCELIVVNDGSNDGTKEFLDQFHPLSRHHLKIIHQDNMKLPAALNRGFTEATGDRLTWVSADCACRSDMLEMLSDALDHCSEAGMAYSSFFFIDKNDRITGKISRQPLTYRDLMMRNNGNASFMYTREAMNKTGIYDERFNGVEDWNYWLRMSMFFPFVYVDSPLYYYRLHEASMQSTMGGEINNAAEEMIAEFFKINGGKFDLGKLYPSIMHVQEREKRIRLIIEMQADCVARLLVARTAYMMQLAAIIIKELLNIDLDPLTKLQVFTHYAIILIASNADLTGALNAAREAIHAVKETDVLGHSQAVKYLAAMKQFVQTQDTSIFSQLSPLWLSENPELFRYDRIYLS